MMTQPHTQRSLALRLAQAVGLPLVLAGGLFAALIITLSPMVVKPAPVQTLQPVAQPNEKEFICRRSSGEVVFTTTLSPEGECERYAVPPAIGLDEHGVLFAYNNEIIQSIALADINGDGDLDIATGNSGDVHATTPYANPTAQFAGNIHLYTNLEGVISDTLVITQEADFFGPTEIAWGDIDNDGDLDLAAATLQNDFVYLMEDGQRIHTIPLTDSVQTEDYGHSERRSTSVAWGDVNGDGRLELAVGNYGRRRYSGASNSPISGTIRLYYFERLEPTGTITIDTVSTLRPSIPPGNVAWVTDLAWAYYDDDKNLDLVVGVILSDTAKLIAAQVYRNDGVQNQVGHFSEPVNISGSNYSVSTDKALIAMAGIDRNETLDYVVSTSRYSFTVGYSPTVELPTTCLSQMLGHEVGILRSFAWGDVDGDGDLDLATGFQGAPDRVYLNQKGCINPNPVWEAEFDSTDSKLGTRSLAWGDMDNDGDLDLVTGGQNFGRIYYNNKLGFRSSLYHTTTLPVIYPSQQLTAEINPGKPFGYVALGDVDLDGDLDIARNIYGQPVHILINESGSFDSSVITSTSKLITTYVNLHFADANGDGRLDLFVANQLSSDTQVYRNSGNLNFSDVVTMTSLPNTLFDGTSVGDINNDGLLDLLTIWNRQLQISNIHQGLEPTNIDAPQSLALGDIDNDGDLDAAITQNEGNVETTGIRIYKNQGGFSGNYTSLRSSTRSVRGIAWGDMNRDGYLDLAVAVNGFDQVYLNQGGQLQTVPAWQSNIPDNTWRLAWGDADGDGDLDLATSSSSARPQRSPAIIRVYLNERGLLQPLPAWESDHPMTDSTSLAWGDLDNDGIQELVTPSTIYKLNRPAQLPLTKGYPIGIDPRVAVAIDRFSNPITPSATITTLAIANFHAMPFVRAQPTIPVTFTLFHPLSQTFDKVQVYYSLNGGGQWFTATGSLTHDPLTSSPFPTRTAANTHVFEWDVIGSNIFGQYQDVVIRIEAYPSLPITGATKLYTNSVPTISLVPSVASQTYPFRLQGKQIQVRGESGKPMVGALVYRRAGSDLGKPLGGSEAPFVTDKDGYLQGRGEIQPGDYLLALAPIITYTEKMTWAKGLTDTLHVYQTNGSQDGDPACQVSHKVTAATTEVLTVTASCPLVLHDLDIALEWDASKDPRYLEQLQFNLQRASQYLYSFTRGQIALGKLNIFQDADLWGYAHVNIHANNRLRPYAVIGGVTMAAATRIISHPTNITETRTYSTGQLHMGAVWNRYGEPNPNPGDDWSLVFAHELGHYLLFLDDTYIGLTNTVNITGQVAITEPVLIKVDDCIGSAMGDVYTTKNHSFIYNEVRWDEKCAVTLANLQLNSPEWETIQYWYPLLVTTTAELTSAVPISYQFSSITIHDPITPTTVLANQDFYLKYENGEVGTSEARAFVVRDDNNDGSDDYIFDLGSPIGTQNLLRARGVQPGDQLCVFDRPRQHFGCEHVTAVDQEIQLYQDEDWNPVVQVTPLTALTYTVNVTNSAAPTLPLTVQARIFPEYGAGSETISLQLSPDGQGYNGTIILTAPAMAGHVQIVNTNNYTTQQAIVAFSIGGNPGDHKMAGGGDRRGGGGNPGDHKMAGGGNKWSLGGGHGDHKMAGGGDFSKGEAPFISPDGQMIFFATDPIHLAVGEFYLIQDMAGLPMPPANTVAIGRGHNLMNSGAVTDFALLSGSISFQYSGLDVLIEKVEEHALNIYYSSAGKPEWKKLPTYRDPYFNLVSARSVGAGIYALFADRRYRNIIDVSPRSVAAGNPITITGNNFRSSMLLALISDDEIRPYLLTSTFVDTTTLQVTLPDYVLSGVYYLEAINTDTIKETTGITLNVTNE